MSRCIPAADVAADGAMVSRPARLRDWQSLRRTDGYAIVHRDDIADSFLERAITGTSLKHGRMIFDRTTSMRMRAELTGAAEGGRISDVQDRDWGMREFYIWDVLTAIG